MNRDRPSRTAYKVALYVLSLGSKPGMDKILPPGIIDATEKLLIASGAVKESIVRLSRSPKMVSLYGALDSILPSQYEAFAHRKAFCERQVRKGIAEGATQTLVLGAGYDTLGWRLAPEFPGVNFFEIDHPATARLKAKGLKAMGDRDNLFLTAEDLANRKLADVLESTGLWDEGARTVFVAEGLLMYLSPEAVRGLFEQCAASSGSGSRIVFTCIPAGADGRPDAGPRTKMMLWYQNAAGEPWLWSIRPEELDRFLKDTGWMLAAELAGAPPKFGVELHVVAVKQGSPSKTGARAIPDCYNAVG